MSTVCTDDPQEVVQQILDAQASAAKLDSFVNGEASETVQLGTGDPTPTLRGVVAQMLDTAYEAIEYDADHPEFLRYYRDAGGKFLWGIRVDGSIEWAKGIPRPVRDYLSSFFAVKPSGSSIASLCDASGAVLEDTAQDGVKTIRGDLRVKGRLLADSLPKSADWSDAASLKIPIPQCARINISGFQRPIDKLVECECWMEFWDMEGSYFRKPIVMGLQGNTTWNLPKPNYKFDLFADKWDGNEFKITFGDWVPQDSFHLKAFYTDLFKGRGIVIYRLYEEIQMLRGSIEDRAWKQAMIDYAEKPAAVPIFGEEEDLSLRLDTGAKCHPDAFPCIVYMDGAFHGLFSFQLKKHRKNYHQVKDNSSHVHLDGTVAQSLFNGFIDWSTVEVRNPSNLYCMDGTEYDGDTNCGELIDSTSPYYSTGSSKVKARKKTTAEAKSHILALVDAMSDLQALDAQYSAADAADKPAIAEQIRTLFQQVFDIRNVADYAIVIDIDNDEDSIGNNCQWTTWDGTKWYVNSYDTNGAFGGNVPGGVVPKTSHFSSKIHPVGFAWKYFKDEMRARYAFLRDSGVLSAANILAMLNAWCRAFGEEAFELERQTWPMMPCWGNAIVDSRHWELVTDGDGNFVTADSVTYSDETLYEAGDTCACGACYRDPETYLHHVSNPTIYTFRCTAECRGIAPVRQLTAADSLWRLKKWLDESIQNFDALNGYSLS